jgi:protein disulfide-isomerase
MKRGVTALVLLIGIILSGCDQPAVAQEEEAGFWMTDYDAALKKAAEENKYVLVNISGHEWCGWCIRLENEVFSKPDFKEYAEENLVAVLLDFARSGEATAEEHAEQHEALLKKFGVRGFPTVLILNPQGKVIERDGYQRGGAPNYIDFIKTVIASDRP